MTVHVPAARRPEKALTARELQVIQGVALGLRYPEIGQQLHLSRETISSHLKTAYAKLGARNGAHAVHIAYSTGLFTVTP